MEQDKSTGVALVLVAGLSRLPETNAVSWNAYCPDTTSAGDDECVIVGIGTDLAEVARIRRSREQFGERFLLRVYTERERRYALSKANWAERLAARFAAKEAGMKAIGTGWSRGVGWQDLEVVNEPSGRPILSLHGAAQRIARELGVTRVSLSMTHTAETAMAVVILESNDS